MPSGRGKPWLALFLGVNFGPCRRCSEVLLFERWRYYSRRDNRRTTSEFGRDLSTGVFLQPEEHECAALPSPATPPTGRTG